MSSGMLQEILHKTKQRVAMEKQLLSPQKLEAMMDSQRKPFDFKKIFLSPGTHIIAEVKLASPSEGDIAPEANPLAVAKDYLSNGATALSVLTEPDFFKGNIDYLSHIRKENSQAHLLMKDFVVDEYQLYQGMVFGADAVLIILAAVGKSNARMLLRKARELGLSALVEVHDASELVDAVDIGATLIGVNNRDLKTMEVSIQTSETLARMAPRDVILISESGISSPQEIIHLMSMGYKGFLIGTSFMKTPSPGTALSKLLKDVATTC